MISIADDSPGIAMALQRIMKRTDRSGACWIWTARLNTHGYAELRVNGQRRMAHRVAYEALVGPIPAGLELDHLCRVRHCVNPAHLEPVTHRTNCLRGLSFVAANARKTECPSGHKFSSDNTYQRPGRRQVRECRACNRAAVRRYKLRASKRVKPS